MHYNITFDDIQEIIDDLSWDEILWGYENKLIGALVIREYSKDRQNKISEFEKSEKINQLIDAAQKDTEQIPLLIRKNFLRKDALNMRNVWLYIVLDWLYKHKSDFDDVFAEVEKVYADFEYPEEIEPFVRYMPPTDGYEPTKYSLQENLYRLYENWRHYLSVSKNKYKKKM